MERNNSKLWEENKNGAIAQILKLRERNFPINHSGKKDVHWAIISR